MSDSPAPKVDDQFWFDYSESLVNNAILRRDTAAQKIQELAVWLWGIFSAYAVVALSLTEVSLDTAEQAFIAATSALLFLVYWLAVWVQMPSEIQFDPRSPELISEAYVTSIRQKNRRLLTTLFFSIVASVAVAASFLVISTEVTPVESEPPAMTLRAALSRDGGHVSLQIYARIDDVNSANVCVVTRACPVDSGGNGQACQFDCSPFITAPNGSFHQTVALPIDTAVATVKVGWEDEYAVIREMRKVVAIPEVTSETATTEP